jgi:hypothetical protein
LRGMPSLVGTPEDNAYFRELPDQQQKTRTKICTEVKMCLCCSSFPSGSMGITLSVSAMTLLSYGLPIWLNLHCTDPATGAVLATDKIWQYSRL